MSSAQLCTSDQAPQHLHYPIEYRVLVIAAPYVHPNDTQQD